MKDKQEMIEIMAEAVAKYESEQPYCVNDNPHGIFDPADYMRQQEAALEAFCKALPDIDRKVDEKPIHADLYYAEMSIIYNQLLEWGKDDGS
jgi:hypothetical protein